MKSRKSYAPVSIDLPAAPLWATTTEGSLSKAVVIAHLLDGSIVSGKLKFLSAPNENFSLKISKSKESAEIAFSKLGYLSFTRKLAIAEERNPEELFGNDDELPSPFQSFSVLSTNGSTISGNSRGFFEDKSGLHIFEVADEHSIRRLFFPAGSVKSHRVGQLLGSELVQHAVVSQKEVDNAMKMQQDLRHKKLVDYLLENKDISREQLQAAVALHKSRTDKKNSAQSGENLGEWLVKDKKISSQQLNNALQRQQSDSSKKLGSCLQEMNILNDKDLHRALASKSGMPFVNLSEYEVDAEAIKLVSRDIASKYSLIPIRLFDKKLVVAMEDPFNTEAIDTVQFVTNLHLELVTATKDDIESAITNHYEVDTFEQDIIAAEDVQRVFGLDKKQERELREAEVFGSGEPIVRLVANFIMDAIHHRASDVHIRPLEKSVDLLFRIDGTLFKIRNFSKTLLPAIISRIKIIGRMNIAERRLPQDGQARVSDKGNVVDLRISVIPTVNGESAVIRLLNTQVGIKTIAQLGFTVHDAEVFAGLLHKSNGLILVTGPTGSGKSTTLYAALQTVIARNLNIITVENPVEYHIDGIEQIQVNTAPGYTFARALRHILRHDPDVIMIGEIRDDETAKIAIESALTGHLVLSTLHTNDAAGAITRLLEMGVEPFLINATMLGIFAQRLVRKNCRKCLLEETVDALVRKALGVAEDATFYKGQGCKHCNNTGYSGRLAVYELLRISPALNNLIQPGVSAHDIHAQALKDGMVPLTENALSQARKRLTSLSEVYRVRLDN